MLFSFKEQNLVGENYAKAGEMQQDPLSHAPRPGKIMTELNVQEPTEGKKDASKPKLYVPPKLSATVMEEDKKKLKKERLENEKRRKLYRSEFVSDLMREVNEEPEEIFIGNPIKEVSYSLNGRIL